MANPTPLFLLIECLFVSSLQISSTSWAEYVGESVSAGFTPEERKRQEAVFELINTEELYLLDMQMILNVCFLFVGFVFFCFFLKHGCHLFP